MAQKKKDINYVALIVVAAILGVALGAIVFNKPEGTPTTLPANVSYDDPYDDSWGKAERPAGEATVTHILITWKGKNPRSTPKDPNRTQEQAKKLVEELWNRYKFDPTDANWKKLQAEYNEDSVPHNEYTCKTFGSNLDEAFNRCGLETKIGKARYIESSFGYHLIRRER